MKLKIFIVIVAVVLAWVAGRSIKSGGQSIVRSVQHEAQGDGAARQGGAERGASERRINESYELADGAQVDVHGINGPVTIEAVDGNTAEVQVTSTAGSMSDLDAHQVIVEHTESSLVVRRKGGDGGGFWRWLRGGGNARHKVLLKLPRRVELAVSGTNGRLSIGEVEGSARIAGVNGRVEMGGVRGFTEVSGVNGGVTLTVVELNEGGLQVSGVNGSVELRLGSGVNAELKLNGINGRMTLEAPNVEVQEQKRDKLRARIGKGGSEIKCSGINGGVRLVGV
ncbi:MAG TPA: hypothetical protein VEZ40_16070 [Pyrinomonadaceae bacterium]|nr:hypothetical protein [Pyrinomonadaceae bacterium]